MTCDSCFSHGAQKNNLLLVVRYKLLKEIKEFLLLQFIG